MKAFLPFSILLLPTAAAAHVQTGTGAGFADGLLHPILGLDHVAAMVAVGIWGSILRMPLLVALPVAFPLMMAGGAMLGILGLPLPGIEIGIAGSALVLGGAIVLMLRPAVWVAVAIVGGFAIFHGYAHGAELPPSAAPLAFTAGFVVATGLLHLLGIGLGEAARQVPASGAVMRGFGAVVAAIGLTFLVSSLGAA